MVNFFINFKVSVLTYLARAFYIAVTRVISLSSNVQQSHTCYDVRNFCQQPPNFYSGIMKARRARWLFVDVTSAHAWQRQRKLISLLGSLFRILLE